MSLLSSLSWFVSLPLSLSLVFVHLGNCDSTLLTASWVPSQGPQPGGDAQEDPPYGDPAPRDCHNSARFFPTTQRLGSVWWL